MQILSLLLLGSIPAFALSGTTRNATAGAVSKIFQFDSDSYWIENIAVRKNDNLLLSTANPAPEVWEFDPSKPGAAAVRVARWSDALASLGITEVRDDFFAVIAGNLTVPSVVNNQSLSNTPGSYSIWTLDLRSGRPRHEANDNATIRRAATIPSARQLNGLATLSSEDGTVLAGDSQQGAVYRINVLTGESAVVLSDAHTMGYGATGLPLGINGVRLLPDNYLYYDNSNKGLLCRVKINPRNGTAAGPYEVVTPGPFDDDMAVREDGRAFVAGANEIVQVLPDGSHGTFLGGLNSSVVAGVTSMQFGRGSGQGDTLYVVTNGAQGGPVNGTFHEPGKVVRVQVEGLEGR